MYRLQVFVHYPRPRKVEGHDLQRDAHGKVGVQIFLPERPQLPTTTRQVPQDSATGEPEKDFANGGAADTILLSGSLFTKQHRFALQAEPHQVIGNDCTPVDWPLRRRHRGGRRFAANRYPSTIFLLEISLLN